jgi:hypothetical protein
MILCILLNFQMTRSLCLGILTTVKSRAGAVSMSTIKNSAMRLNRPISLIRLPSNRNPFTIEVSVRYREPWRKLGEAIQKKTMAVLPSTTSILQRSQRPHSQSPQLPLEKQE